MCWSFQVRLPRAPSHLGSIESADPVCSVVNWEVHFFPLQLQSEECVHGCQTGILPVPGLAGSLEISTICDF